MSDLETLPPEDLAILAEDVRNWANVTPHQVHILAQRAVAAQALAKAGNDLRTFVSIFAGRDMDMNHAIDQWDRAKAAWEAAQ